MPEGLRLSDILDWSSYKRFKRLDAVSTIKVPTLQSRPFKFKRKGRGEYIIPSSSTVDFSSYDSSLLEEIWCRLEKSRYDFSSIELICPHNLKFELMRTYYALLFWSYTPGEKLYTVDYIFKHSLLDGPLFAERLSDEWDYGIRRFFHIGGYSSSFSDWRAVTHYNALPPVAYLIRWSESSDDIKYMKIPLWDFDKNLMKELRYEILESLPDSLELPEDVEVLSEVKTSTSLDLDKMKSIPFYQARLSPLGREFSHIFKAKRAIIPVGPSNTRDAVVTTIDTYNSIKWCDLVLGGLLNNEEESLINDNPQVFIRRLKGMTRIPRRGQMYWLRDIKKCGLTFPRELFHLVQECLSEKYPDKDFSRFDIYKYYSIYDTDNKRIEGITRGYCLGMANNLVTYIQCMISKMLLKRIPPKIGVEALYGNDDSCLKIYAIDKNDPIDEFDAMLIQCTDFDILRGLNIITNDKKSFFSWWPILFEEYGHQDFRIKHSRIACALSSAMLAPDIKYAKFLTSAISLALWDDGDWIVSPLTELINKWGYEFYAQECNYDYTLGGWISIRNKGMNPMLRMIENAPDELIQPMWVAANQINHFQKEVIKPVLEGSVSKNYSVTGQLLNITYVDIEIYDIPELPVENIFLNEKSYRKFYESIYRFNRYPYEEMAKRLRRVTSANPGRVVDRLAFMEFCLKNFNKLAIPKTLVLSETYVYEIRKDSNLDCSSLMRNSLSRFIQKLKEDNILMCSDLNVPASGEYPYVRKYDATPYTEQIYGVTTLNGDIPEGIYQFSTNPWLPLYEYTQEYDSFPTVLSRTVEDKAHLPIWFMNKHYEDSLEISVAYDNMDLGELVIDDLLAILRERHQLQPIGEQKEFAPLTCDLCAMNMLCQWDEEVDIWNMNEGSCILCRLGDDLWRARKLSQIADTLEKRAENTQLVPMLRSRIRFVIDKYFPSLTERLPYLCQETAPCNDIFYAGIHSDEEDNLLDMFGD